MVLSFDASVHIRRAIGLVNGNLVLGVFLSLGVLWWFLRGWRATLMIATTIPVFVAVVTARVEPFGPQSERRVACRARVRRGPGP